MAIAEMLKTNGSITALDLGVNNIRCEGALAIADAIDMNGTLKGLNLADNDICNKQGCPHQGDAVEKLADALTRHNITLERLNLAENGIGKETILCLTALIRFPKSGLRELDVSLNPIGDGGGAAFAKNLLTSPLEKLSLAEVGLRHEGPAAFAEVLQHNTVLRHLDLSTNSIGPEVSHKLVEVLQDVNSTLESLDLSENVLGAEGLKPWKDYNGNCVVLLRGNVSVEDRVGA